MYVLAKFQLLILNIFEVTALQSRSIAVLSIGKIKYRYLLKQM